MSRAMVRTGFRTAAAILVALTYTACDSPFRPNLAGAQSAGEAVSRSATQAAPPVVIDDSYASYSYQIDGSGAGTFSENVPHASLATWERPPPLELGAWTIDVAVLDSSSATVGLGSASATLSGGSLTIPVTVSAAGGIGTLMLDVNWTPTELAFGTTHEFELIVEPRPSGASLDLSAELAVDFITGNATLARDLPSGSYLMRMGIIVDGARVWGSAKSLLILPGSNTVDSQTLAPGAFNAPPFAYPSVLGGAFVPGATIRLLGGGPGTTVRYTTDGSDPSGGSVYASGTDIALSDGMTLRTYAENAFGAQEGGPWFFIESTDGLYVNDIDGDDGYPGTNAGPKKTLQAAVAMANGMGGAPSVRIHVAGETAGTGGTYEVPAGLTIRRPMELLGGYDPLDGSWLARDIYAYPTTIKRVTNPGEVSNPAAPIAVLRFPETLGGATLIEGFTIRNQVPTVDHTAVVIIAAAGVVTLRANDIRNDCNNELSAGVIIADSKPILDGNGTIEGGFGIDSVGVFVTGAAAEPSIKDSGSIQATGVNVGASRSTGIVFTNGARGVVDNCSVQGGIGQTSFGIASRHGANPTVTASSVNGAGQAGFTTLSIGILIEEASAQIVNNLGAPDGIRGGPGDVISAGIYTNASQGSLLIEGNASIRGGQSTAAGRSVGIVMEGGATPSLGAIKLNANIQGGNAGQATGIWIRKAATPLIESNTLIQAGGGALTATARGIYIEGSGADKPEPIIRTNTGIRGGNATTSVAVDVEQSGPGLLIESNSNILGVGMSGVGSSYGIRMPNVMPGALGSILNNANVDGGVGANSYGVGAERGLMILSGNVIRGGSGSSTSTGIQLKWVADVKLVGGNAVFGRSSGAGLSYAMYIENSSPEISGENHFHVGDSGGGSASYGISVYGPNVSYPAGPLIGDGVNKTHIYGAPMGTTGKAVALSITGAYASGVYDRISAKAREAGAGQASALYIASNARPTIRNSHFVGSETAVTGSVIGAEIMNISDPGLLIEDSTFAGKASGSVLTSGMVLTDVASARIRRSKIWSGAASGPDTQRAVIINSSSSDLSGLSFVSNVIISPSGPGLNIAVRLNSSYFGTASPRFYGNTIIARDAGFAFHNIASGGSSRSAPLLVNNILWSTGFGRGFVEESNLGGIPDPLELRNNSFIGGDNLYRDSVNGPQDLVQINTAAQILQSSGISSGNISETPSFVTIGTPANYDDFMAFDWRLLAVAPLGLRTGGYNDLPIDTGWPLGDFNDLYGQTRSAPYSIGAAEF